MRALRSGRPHDPLNQPDRLFFVGYDCGEFGQVHCLIPQFVTGI
jgi:hypothetical protein